MFRRKRKSSDFRAEIEAHIELERDRLLQQGLSPEDAQAAARRAFGNVLQTEERFYESGRWMWWDNFRQDVRFGVRMLMRNPGFTVTVVLTLALSIGANTAIFSLVNALLLKSLPYAHPEHLAAIYGQTTGADAYNMRRSIELTGLGHRKFYRAHADIQQRMRARFDAIPVSKTRYKAISAPAQKAVVQAINRATEPFASKPPLARQERELEKVIKLISLFEPFILHNDHVFEAANVERLSAALPPDEQAELGYDSRALDWWDYWINVHIPALRKWCYPLIEGRQPESRPRRSVPLASRNAADAASARSGPATAS